MILTVILRLAFFLPVVLVATPATLHAQDAFPAPGPTRFTPGPAPPFEREPVDPEFGRFVRSRWVILDEDKGLNGAIGTLETQTGKLNPTNALRVELYDQDAVLRKRVTTGPDGTFRITDLESGTYQLVAQGSRGFLAFTLSVIDRGQKVGGLGDDPIVLVQAPRFTRDTLDVISAAVPPTFTQLNSILQLNYGLTTPAYSVRGAEPDALPERAANGLDGPPKNSNNNNQGGVAPLPVTPLRTYQVPLLDGNRIRGRLYATDGETGSPVKVNNVYVHIIRNDQPVGPPIPVNDQGEFEAELFDGPGAYSIVAAGRDGFGASGFYALPAVEEEASRPTAVFFVDTRLAQNQPGIGPIPRPANPAQNAANDYGFTMGLVNLPVLQQALPAAAGLAPPPLPPPAGIANQGVAGGGSGGGLGALLLGSSGLAGLAGLARDSRVIQEVPPLASPFLP